MKYQLDLTTYRCPMPLLITKKALKSLQQGDMLSLKLNSENGSSDIQLYCHQQGYQFSQIEQGLILTIEITI